MFIQETGKAYPSYLVSKKIKKRMRSLDPRSRQPLVYRTWIITSPFGEVTGLKLLDLNFNSDWDSLVNVFNLRGVIAQIDSQQQTTKIVIARNNSPPPGKERARQWQPFAVDLSGNLPIEAAINQFWEIYAHWQADGKLAIAKASYIAPMDAPQLPEIKDWAKGTRPKVEVKQQESSADTNARTTDSDRHQPGKPQPSPDSKPVEKPQQKVSAHSQPTPPQIVKLQKTPKKTTTGRLEIAIKINTFPKEVKTLSNNSKQFDVDCDGRIVSVTVKPKIWKKLAQAQQDYPMWVAAIVGKMGAATAKGFKLDQPTIQVFEKNPKI